MNDPPAEPMDVETQDEATLYALRTGKSCRPGCRVCVAILNERIYNNMEAVG